MKKRLISQLGYQPPDWIWVKKIFKNHPWIKQTNPLPATATPMIDTADYQSKLENAEPLSDRTTEI